MEVRKLRARKRVDGRDMLGEKGSEAGREWCSFL